MSPNALIITNCLFWRHWRSCITKVPAVSGNLVSCICPDSQTHFPQHAVSSLYPLNSWRQKIGLTTHASEHYHQAKCDFAVQSSNFERENSATTLDQCHKRQGSLHRKLSSKGLSDGFPFFTSIVAPCCICRCGRLWGQLSSTFLLSLSMKFWEACT